MSRNIYELNAEYQTLQRKLEDGEPVELELAGTLEEIKAKIEAYWRVYKNLEGNHEIIESEKARLDKLDKPNVNGMKRIKETIEETMKRVDLRKLDYGWCKLNIQKNGGNAPLVWIEGLDANNPPEGFPEECIKVTKSFDSNAMRKYIVETGDVSFAEIGERGESLRVR